MTKKEDWFVKPSGMMLDLDGFVQYAGCWFDQYARGGPFIEFPTEARERRIAIRNWHMTWLTRQPDELYVAAALWVDDLRFGWNRLGIMFGLSPPGNGIIPSRLSDDKQQPRLMGAHLLFERPFEPPFMFKDPDIAQDLAEAFNLARASRDRPSQYRGWLSVMDPR
jgi:hypothetical protein